MKLLYLVESGKSKFLVFDEMPDKISTKYGDDTIIGRIGGIFYDFLAKRNERREAFGGRKFDIVLDNGEIEKCEGQWWDAVTDRAREELEKDENRQEMDAKHLDCLVPIRKLELQEYLSPEILKMEHI